MIISISGRFRSGKDTVYNFLSKKIPIKRVAFADILKDSCSEAFGIEREFFYEDSLKDRLFDHPFLLTGEELESLANVCGFEPNDNYFAVGDGKILRSPREILQFVGTDLVRRTIQDSFWLDHLVDNVKKTTNSNSCVTDSRFFNERKKLKDIGAKLVLVTRPENSQLLGGAHSSENDLGTPDEYDYVIENSGSLEELEEKVKEFAKKLI